MLIFASMLISGCSSEHILRKAELSFVVSSLLQRHELLDK